MQLLTIGPESLVERSERENDLVICIVNRRPVSIRTLDSLNRGRWTPLTTPLETVLKPV